MGNKIKKNILEGLEEIKEELIFKDKITEEVVKESIKESVKEAPVIEEVAEELTKDPQSKVFQKGVVNCGILRIRSNPNIKSKELGRINKGEIVKIKIGDSTENFYSVKTNGGIDGFCLKDFIDLI